MMGYLLGGAAVVAVAAAGFAYVKDREAAAAAARAETLARERDAALAAVEGEKRMREIVGRMRDDIAEIVRGSIRHDVATAQKQGATSREIAGAARPTAGCPAVPDAIRIVRDRWLRPDAGSGDSGAAEAGRVRD